MAVTQKDNSGALFRNERKEHENQPDVKGIIMVSGIEYWISGWDKTSKDGLCYTSLSVTKKEKRKDQPTPKQDDNQDSGLPF